MANIICSIPMLAGNVASLLAPCVFVPVFSFVFRSEKYDWQSMKQIRKGDDSGLAAEAHMDLEKIPGESHHTVAQDEQEQRKLQRAAKIARGLTLFLTIALLILWPMPMYGSGYIFSKKFFTGWVSVAILWLFCSAFCVGVYPLWEGRHTSSRTIKAIFLDITGRRKPVIHGQATITHDTAFEEKMDQKNTATPPEVEVESN